MEEGSLSFTKNARSRTPKVDAIQDPSVSENYDLENGFNRKVKVTLLYEFMRH